MQDDILEVMITEYKILRGEIYKKYEHQIQIFAIIFSALGVIYGIAFAYESILILLIPLIAFPLGLRFQYSTRGVVILGRYLKELESQIKKKKNYVDWKGWTGYQNYYSNKEHSWLIDIVYDASARWLMFIFMPMVVAVWYSFTYNTHIWLGQIYIFLIISSPFVVWIINGLGEQKILKKKPKMNKFETFISALIALGIESILTFWEPINRVWTELFGIIYKIYEMSPEKPIMVFVAIKVIEFLLLFVGILVVILAGKRVVSSIK